LQAYDKPFQQILHFISILLQCASASIIARMLNTPTLRLIYFFEIYSCFGLLSLSSGAASTKFIWGARRLTLSEQQSFVRDTVSQSTK